MKIITFSFRLWATLLVSLLALTGVQGTTREFYEALQMAVMKAKVGIDLSGYLGYGYGCPSICSCPPQFPNAMSCEGQKLEKLPAIPQRIQYLYLNNNQIDEIKEDFFANASGLSWLVMQYNNLVSDTISGSAFTHLEGLQRLYLDYNSLSEIPGSLPTGLKELSINHNRLNKLDIGYLVNLTKLRINYNSLTDLGDSLKNLQSLKLFEASGNKIKQLPLGLPTSLRQFYIEGNEIDSVSEDYFSSMSNLSYVRLSGNKLQNSGVPSSVFNIPSLVELDLAYNNLSKVPLVSPNLKYLYLQGNSIEELSPSSFCHSGSYSDLRVLRLDGNKIKRSDLPLGTYNCLQHAWEMLF
uniref:Fibromodulin n=1 Tax=Eptatretus burgeri TaxID=7764 RepID=A0A8C4NNI1_EPTBU